MQSCTAETVTGAAEPIMNLPQPGAKYIFALRPAPQKLYESEQASGKMRGLHCGTCYRFRGTENKSAQVSSKMLTPSFTSVAEPVIGSGGTYINLHTSQAKCTVCRAPLSSTKILLLEQGRP